MGKLYRSREGEATAVDTKTQLTTLGSEPAPGPLLVPAGYTKLNAVWVAMCQNMAAATGYSAFIRLEGGGMAEGPETLAAGAGGNNVATGGNGVAYVKRLPLGVKVTPGNEVLIFAEMAGTDVGQVSVGATLEFSK